VILPARAESLPELLEKLTYQYFDALLPLESVGEAIREKVVAEGDTPEALLNAWFKSLANLTLIDGMVFRSVHLLALRAEGGHPLQVRAEAIGELIDPTRHLLRIDRSRLGKLRVTLENSSPNLFAQIIFP